MATILVPLDGSTFSEQALSAAIELAKRMGARLHLVRAHQLPPVPMTPELAGAPTGVLEQSIREAEQEYLGTVANRCMEAGVSARTDLLDGPAAMALAAYAQEVGIDLIVMTTHGRGGISRAWVGSVADALVRRCTTPVLLLRPDEAGEVPTVLAKHVLIPLDGSDLSAGIVDAATMLGSLSDARYTLLYVNVVVAPPLGLGVDGPPIPFAASLSEARSWLDSVAARLRRRGLAVETDVLTHTTAAQGILDWAGENDVDLIALATHGRGGWSRMALGSVADKVMRGAHVPVLLYRPRAPVQRGEAVEAGAVEGSTR